MIKKRIKIFHYKGYDVSCSIISQNGKYCGEAYIGDLSSFVTPQITSALFDTANDAEDFIVFESKKWVDLKVEK